MTSESPRLGDDRSFPAHPASLYDVREFVRMGLERSWLPPEVAGDLLLAASEACANAVVHSGSEKITVRWEGDDRSVMIEVADEGIFKRRVPLPEFDETHGHGIPLMVALVDELTIREGTRERPGTTVRLTQYREP